MFICLKTCLKLFQASLKKSICGLVQACKAFCVCFKILFDSLQNDRVLIPLCRHVTVEGSHFKMGITIP